MGKADFDAIAQIVTDDRPFLFGDAPRTADAALFGFLEAVLGCPLDNELKRHAESHAHVVAYRQRIRDKWWTDLRR